MVALKSCKVGFILDEHFFSGAVPLFELLFPGNDFFYVAEDLIVKQVSAVVLLSKGGTFAALVLMNAARKISDYSKVVTLCDLIQDLLNNAI